MDRGLKIFEKSLSVIVPSAELGPFQADLRGEQGPLCECPWV